jgi:hypothetical protein
VEVFMRALLSFVCFAAACTGGGLGEHTPDQPAPPVEPQSAGVCLNDGSFDFHVYGDGLTQWDGKSIAATALEPQQDLTTQTTSLRIPVRMGSQITDGAFSISCPSSLDDNSYYPSYALFVDVNDDGRCDDGDFGLNAQRYGWNQAIDDQIVAPDVEAPTFLPVGELQPAIGSDAFTFCYAYFP